MNPFAIRSLAASVAVLLSLVSIGTVIAVPPAATHATRLAPLA